jgi:hypothetical protein
MEQDFSGYVAYLKILGQPQLWFLRMSSVIEINKN